MAVNRNNLSVPVMLSPIASGTTPSDPSTIEGGSAIVEAETIAESVAAESIHSSYTSSGATEVQAPEAKRPKPAHGEPIEIAQVDVTIQVDATFMTAQNSPAVSVVSVAASPAVSIVGVAA